MKLTGNMVSVLLDSQNETFCNLSDVKKDQNIGKGLHTDMQILNQTHRHRC